MKPITIAEIFGKSIKTIERWIILYITEGINSLTSYNYKEKKPYLNTFQKNQIYIYVSFENPETLKEILCYIKEHFGIEYSIEGIRKILKELGLKLIKGRTIPGNPPSVEIQKDFIKNYHEMRSIDNSVTLFADAMHLIHQNLSTDCWGNPLFPPLNETNTSRRRINILGAYNPSDCSFLHISSEENCNAERALEILKHILITYSKASIINVIVDNARYFHAKIVREWLKENDRIKLIFLPAYSPNLNLIERFWKYAKKTLVRNKYYKEYKEFRAKTFQFFNNVKDHYKNIKKLMVEKFQIIYA